MPEKNKILMIFLYIYSLKTDDLKEHVLPGGKN